MTRVSSRTRSRFVDVVLIGFGMYSVALGVFMLVAPGVFFSGLGAFGARNDHYIFDNASFELPLGLLLLAAFRWPTWRVPALLFATAHWALHALSHIIDTHNAAGVSVWLLEFGGLALGTVLLGIAASTALSASSPKVQSSPGNSSNRGRPICGADALSRFMADSADDRQWPAATKRGHRR